MTTAFQGKQASTSGKRIHAPLDPDSRPGRVPAPWSELAWRPLAPFRNDAKARVFWAQDGERRLVCKDGSLALRRRLVGRFRRWALANEARALGALDGVHGLPRLVAHWESGLIMEFVPGRMLTEWKRGTVPEEVFAQVDRIVDEIHARHFTIGDLHRRNILVDDALAVHLVDFELALDRRRGLGRLLGGQLERLDRLAAARQRQYHGARLDPEQAALLEHRPLPYRMLRRLKRWLRTMRPRERAPR